MAQVTLENVSKRFDEVVAVRDVNLMVKDREFVVLVGPSGCGKSTTLRMIAGLEEITAGTIKIGDRVVNDVPPKDRDIAMVFQNYALYPHMTVYDNMAFGLKLRKFPKAEIQQRVQDAAEILGIQELLTRKPRALSGGQRQRVAVGRAIVRKPQVFLFDEPLSNLDAKLRVAMRAELKKLHDRLQATVVYVTHDQVEAMTMGDRIVIMKDGLIQQVGAPLEVYAFPQNQFVAGFIGSPAMNFISCTVTARDGNLFFIAPGLALPVPATKANMEDYTFTNTIWDFIENPSATKIKAGEAYWVYCEGASEYRGPLEIILPGLKGFDYGKYKIVKVTLNSKPLSLADTHRILINRSVLLENPSNTIAIVLG